MMRECTRRQLTTVVRALKLPKGVSKNAPLTSQNRTSPPSPPPPPFNRGRRTELDCEHFGACSGCSLQHRLANPPQLAQALALFASLQLPPSPPHYHGPHAWRCRAKLAVRGTSMNPLIGLYAKGTHDVLPLPSCRIHHPRINQAVGVVQELVQRLGIEPYNESNGTGELRYVQLTVTSEEKRGGDEDGDLVVSHYSSPAALVQLVLVWNGNDDTTSKRLALFADALWQQHASLFHSIAANVNASRTNEIFGREWMTLHGPSLYRHVLSPQPSAAHQPIYFAPGSFMQANLLAFTSMMHEMERFLSPHHDLCEMHAGVGAMGLDFLSRGLIRSVRCIELNPTVTEPFNETVKSLQQYDAKAKMVVEAAGTDPLEHLSQSDLVLVDPPRKGLEPSLLAALAAPPLRLKRIMYLSCGLPALEHDAKRLLESRQWRAVHGATSVFFPGSDLVETLLILDRVE